MERAFAKRTESFWRREVLTVTVLSAASDKEIEPRVAAPWGGTVLLLMLVVAMGHFNRIGITVAGAERIIPQNGVSPRAWGWSIRLSW